MTVNELRTCRSRFSIVEDLAATIRKYYISSYRSKETSQGRPGRWTPGVYWDGGWDSNRNIERESAWKKAAEFLLKHQLGVGPYLHYLIWDHSRGLPKPSWIWQKKIHEAYDRYVELSGQDEEMNIFYTFNIQQQTLRQAVAWHNDAVECGFDVGGKSGIQRRILADRHIALSALFRLCLAASEGLQDFYDEYHVAAVTQYVQAADLYDAVWGDWIPVSFREGTRQLCNYEMEGMIHDG